MLEGRSHAEHPLTQWLRQCGTIPFTTYAIAASFSAYFCMYAFRKPFTAAKFEGLEFAGTQLDLKAALMISQIIGYALSKFIGIRVCSELTRRQLASTLVLLIVWAELALVLFGTLPDDVKLLALFLNGLPLGMVWGLVVRYLEGRQTSEILLAGLSCSFIVSSAMVKDFGRMVVKTWGFSEGWMPAVTGACFLPLFLVSAWLLNKLPEPTHKDQQQRSVRLEMEAAGRWSFIRGFFAGLVMLIAAYFFLTAFRDFRDLFMVEVYEEMGYEYQRNETIFTRSEWIVGFGVMLALALLNAIRDNRRGLIGAYGIMVGGLIMMAVATLLHDQGALTGFWWMTLIGLGSYLTYVPFGSILFDRLIASTRVAGTAVFAIYVMDATGYIGSVVVQLYKAFQQPELSYVEFLRQFTYFTALFGAVMLLASLGYFLLRVRAAAAELQPAS